jgi:hypothetical protein
MGWGLLMGEYTPEELKKIHKEAFKEWLDEKATAFGWASFKFIFFTLVGGLLYWAAQHGLVK